MKKTTTYIIIGTGVAALLGTGIYLLTKSKGKAKEGDYGNTSSSSTTPTVGKGLPTSTTPKGKAVREPNWKNPYDMNYQGHVESWITPKKVVTLSEEQLKPLAQKLHDAKGYFTNDFNAVKQVFTQLKDKVQVSRLSGVFYIHHGKKDMWQYLKSFMSDKMETHVHVPVRQLPNYRLKPSS